MKLREIEEWGYWLYDHPDQTAAPEHENLMLEMGERAGTALWMIDDGWMLLHKGDISLVF